MWIFFNFKSSWLRIATVFPSWIVADKQTPEQALLNYYVKPGWIMSTPWTTVDFELNICPGLWACTSKVVLVDQETIGMFLSNQPRLSLWYDSLQYLVSLRLIISRIQTWLAWSQLWVVWHKMMPFISSHCVNGTISGLCLYCNIFNELSLESSRWKAQLNVGIERR